MANEVTSLEGTPSQPEQRSASELITSWLDESEARGARHAARESQKDHQRFHDRLVRKLGNGSIGDHTTLEGRWERGRVTPEQVAQTLATLALNHGITVEVMQPDDELNYEESQSGDRINRQPQAVITNISDQANTMPGRHRAR